MSKPRPSYILLLDMLLLIIVMGYITLPVEEVPFHGDESTTIWMSEDYQTALLDGDFADLAYQEPPRRTTEQHMRIITSNLSKIAMGLSWQGSGMTQDDLNEQWVWGFDLQQNQANKSLPSPKLLYVTRLSSAWLLALSTIFILATARLLARQLFANRWVIVITGWATVIIYTFFYPAILLNGRRAMFEGGLLFGLALVSWACVWILTKQRKRWLDYVLLGICTGLALSTKHSVAFTIILLYSSLLLTDFIRYMRTRIELSLFITQILKLGVATIWSLFLFLLLNPLWWSNPLEMPAIVIEQRQLILDEQATYFPETKYESTSERLTGLREEMITPTNQYYEAAYWADYAGVSAEINQYQHSLWSGLEDRWVLSILRGLMLISGLIFIIYQLIQNRQTNHNPAILIVMWFSGMVLLTFLTVPLHWQRYYLPLLPPTVITMGLGIGANLSLFFKRFSRL